MKKNLFIYTLVLATTLAVSCNKLIEVPDNPPTQIPESRVFSDSADIYAAVAGVYANFKANTANGSLGSTIITVNTSLTTGELKCQSYLGGASMMNVTWTMSDGMFAGLWSSGYNNIYQMNACINGISGTNALTDSTKRQLVAEMKVTRAFYYFQLVNLFGGVPIITGTDYNVNKSMPRASVDEVWAFIRADLAAAREVLTPTYASRAGRYRPNLYAAEALSARVFLYRQQWDSAALMAGHVINSGVYQLLNDPGAVFLLGSKEAIWALPGNLYTPSTTITQQTGEGYTLYPSAYSVNYWLDSTLIRAFEPNDLRFTKWVQTKTLYGTSYPVAAKYKNNTNTNTTTANSEDYMMLRLADMYLILAEADTHLGNTSDAITNLNIIRKRATLNDYAGSNDDLLAAIYHERQIEFAFEWGNRWYDLKRTGTIDNVLGPLRPNWKSTAALYPIPATELVNNPFLTQNDGY